jgi:hypothetical protein
MPIGAMACAEEKNNQWAKSERAGHILSLGLLLAILTDIHFRQALCLEDAPRVGFAGFTVHRPSCRTTTP